MHLWGRIPLVGEYEKPVGSCAGDGGLLFVIKCVRLLFNWLSDKRLVSYSSDKVSRIPKVCHIAHTRRARCCPPWHAVWALDYSLGEKCALVLSPWGLGPCSAVLHSGIAARGVQ